MDLQPTLMNSLIFLRPLAEDDFEKFFDVAKDAKIWTQHPNFDRYQRHVFVQFFKDAMNSGGAFAVIDQSTQKMIGSSRFVMAENDDTTVEIGWTFLARSHWGGTFNKALKTLMIDHAFRYLDKVVFHVGKENYRSARAVEKIGGQKITKAKLHHLLKDKEKNWSYLITKENWIKMG